MLLIVCVLRAMYGKDRMCGRDLIPIVVLAAAVAPCKIVYSVSVLLVLFIPADRFSSRRAALFYKAGVFAAAALSIVILRLLSVTELASSASTVQMLSLIHISKASRSKSLCRHARFNSKA